MEKYTDVTAIILAGGNSSRMGLNKALLKINGQTVIERLVERMDTLFEKILLSINNFGEFGFLEKKMIKDIFPNYGPLSGIHAGLVHSSTQKNFFISCDLPLIDTAAIEYLLNINSKTHIVLPVTNSIPQYDCGLYSNELITIIEEMIRNKEDEKPSLKKLLKMSEATLINANNFPSYRKEIFYNMNTVEDYKFVLEHLEKNGYE